MSKQLVTAQDADGRPLGDFFVTAECGIDNPKHWLKGTLRFAAGGNAVDLHVDLIAVTPDADQVQVACDPMFNGDLASVFQLSGDAPLTTLHIGEFDYVVAIYPFAE